MQSQKAVPGYFTSKHILHFGSQSGMIIVDRSSTRIVQPVNADPSTCVWFNPLKGLAQAKIIEKSVILFWLLNMTI